MKNEMVLTQTSDVQAEQFIEKRFDVQGYIGDF